MAIRYRTVVVPVYQYISDSENDISLYASRPLLPREEHLYRYTLCTGTVFQRRLKVHGLLLMTSDDRLHSTYHPLPSLQCTLFGFD